MTPERVEEPSPEAPGAVRIRGNLARVREAIGAAARQAGREPSSITLVAVTKSVGVREARWLLDAGQPDLGENRPESLLAKARDPALVTAKWHLIGTYQRRKVRDTLAAIALVHSVHAVELARALSARAVELGRDLPCLMQVNVSGEASKQGFAPDEAARAFDQVRSLPALRWRGLMTMAPDAAPPEVCRGVFAATRNLRDRLADTSTPLPELSMGMSRDFVEAILEGATLVRIGTALFEVSSAPADS